jgi:hypothetical protein
MGSDILGLLLNLRDGSTLLLSSSVQLANRTSQMLLRPSIVQLLSNLMACLPTLPRFGAT